MGRFIPNSGSRSVLRLAGPLILCAARIPSARLRIGGYGGTPPTHRRRTGAPVVSIAYGHRGVPTQRPTRLDRRKNESRAPRTDVATGAPVVSIAYGHRRVPTQRPTRSLRNATI